jgi:hypothetical protein
MFNVPADALVHKALAVITAFRRGSAEVSLDVRIGNHVKHSAYWIDKDGTLRLTVRLKGSSGSDPKPVDRIYTVAGNFLTVYDPKLNQVMRQPILAAGSLADRLNHAIGLMPDPVRVVCEAGFADKLWTGLRREGTFQVAQNGRAIELHSPRSAVRIDFSNRGAISGFIAATPKGQHYEWTIHYSPVVHPFVIPATAVMVGAFDAKLRTATYADSAAHAKSRALLTAMKALRPSIIDVRRDDSRVLLYWDRGKIRQEGGGFVWAYDGHRLAVSTRKNYYHGVASREDVLDYLAVLTHGADPLARELLERTTPLQDFFVAPAHVRLVGSLVVGGHPATIVEITGEHLRSSLYVRNSDNLVVGIDSDTLGPSGKVLVHEHTDFGYRPLRDSGRQFTLGPRPGQSTKPLPKGALVYPTSAYGRTSNAARG